MSAKPPPEATARPADFQRNVAAVNEALLIASLHQHELRMATEQSNARLQVEIGERKRAEQDLREAQARLLSHAGAMEQTIADRTSQLRASVGELEAFSYTLAHDLRAPVRAIQGFTQLAIEMPHEEIGTSAVELLQRVVKAAVRMDGLIQDVLNLSQVIRRPMKIEPVDVEALVRALIEERPELSPPLADIRIDGPLLRMMGHGPTLSQCLSNLLSNAVKFVGPGVAPRVRIWTEERIAPATGAPRSPLALPDPIAPAARPVVRLWIEDNGIGIDAAAQTVIFEIFQRLHNSAQYEGSGIGLAIVRKAIERMDGQVGVESAPGHGCRFWLELPRI
jgi:signal transduction histidine kinase